jgi:uncharacterized protein (TIGR00730 family)
MSDGGPIAVTVFGANDAREGDAAYERARAVGATLARLGYTVVNGGYGGTMEAAARGAKGAGGSTVGVVCSVWKSRANRYIDRCVQTGSLQERIEQLIARGEGGYVVLPGATGTLTELAMVWELMCKGIAGRRPLVCVSSFWRPLVDMMAAAKPGAEQFVSVIERPEELEAVFPPVRPA